jgi:O-antigen/teichoic acid export membrane protein
MQNFQISGKILARNTVLNLLGQTIPLLIGIVAIRFIISGLGTERFGLLSLIWVVLGYFTIFDLGLARATTKYVAEALGKGEAHEISRTVWTAVTVQALLGILGTIGVAAFTPILVERILNISPMFLTEARTSFYILALSVPIVLISSSFSGVLEAAQRFDLINAVKAPSSTLTFLLPLLGLALHFKLPGIILLILLGRVASMIAFILLALYIAPQIKKYSGSLHLFKRLLTFGGWVTITNIIGPILQYIDRFLIGALMTMGVVAYYTAPFEVTSRLWIIPGSLVMTMFPAFSTMGLQRVDDLKFFFIRASKYMFLFVSLITFVMIVFAKEILGFWLGNEFVQNSTLVFQILATGVLVSSLTHLALALFQGIGRPEITAKIQLLLLPVSVLLAWLLIINIGIVGAALAWALSRIIGMLFSWIIVWRIIHLDKATFVKHKIFVQISSFILFAALFLPLLLLNSTLIKLIGTVFLITLFLIISWHYVLDVQDRTILLTYYERIVNRKPPPIVRTTKKSEL